MNGQSFVRGGRLPVVVFAAVMLVVTLQAGPVLGQPFPLPLTNHKSGISVMLSGTNGTNWAVETSYHDEEIADQTLYVKSSVGFSMSHNANNTICNWNSAWTWTPSGATNGGWVVVLGTYVPPGAPNGGEICYKIDRDIQASSGYAYGSPTDSLFPPGVVPYTTSFSFNTLKYGDTGSTAVLGKTGSNGGAWGTEPADNPNLFWYGINDSVGNEWHVLTYWDNDEPLLIYENCASGRTQASDGYCVPVCVNPLTPIIQLSASGADQFFTTPVKTYFIPKIWDRTSYLTSGVRINFVNLTNTASVMYKADAGSWTTWNGTALVASALFSGSNTLHTLQVKCGASGTVLTRSIDYIPDYPAPSEVHGNLLWSNSAERQTIINKITTVQPFAAAFQGQYGNPSSAGLGLMPGQPYDLALQHCLDLSQGSLLSL